MRECEDLPFLIIQEGDVFGIIDLVPESGQSMIDKEVTRTFTVMAMEDSEVLCLSIEVSFSLLSRRISRRCKGTTLPSWRYSFSRP